MKHSTPSPLAGQTVTIRPDAVGLGGKTYRVEDYWDRVSGGSWMYANGNPAALQYAVRSVGIPIDDEVLYGKIGDLGYLVHVSEIATDADAAQAGAEAGR